MAQNNLGAFLVYPRSWLVGFGGSLVCSPSAFLSPVLTSHTQHSHLTSTPARYRIKKKHRKEERIKASPQPPARVITARNLLVRLPRLTATRRSSARDRSHRHRLLCHRDTFSRSSRLIPTIFFFPFFTIFFFFPPRTLVVKLPYPAI